VFITVVDVVMDETDGTQSALDQRLALAQA